MAQPQTVLINRVRARHLLLMQRTLDILNHIVQVTPTEDLTRYTDGPEGWSALEILCHLRDFDVIFYNRVQRILNEEMPSLDAHDHEGLAAERDYIHEDSSHAFAALAESRKCFIELFESLTPEQWERSGIHPENGEWTVTDALMQVGHHDVNHLEQMTRVLSQREGNH
jgi:hypothetical protein